MAKNIGVLNPRYGNPLETDAICMQHGANSLPQHPAGVYLTEDDRLDGDLLVDGVQCCLCGDWIIPVDPEVARLSAEREAVPDAERATHPLWQAWLDEARSHREADVRRDSRERPVLRSTLPEA